MAKALHGAAGPTHKPRERRRAGTLLPFIDYLWDVLDTSSRFAGPVEDPKMTKVWLAELQR
jgi:hypothetical protein